MDNSAAEEYKPNVLIVDDLDSNLFALKKLLSKLDAQVETAASGQEAIDKVKNSEYALIILDVQMPGMDGFEAAKEIQKLNNGKTVPIIFLTANMKTEQSAYDGYDAGAVDYLVKPIEPDLIKEKVNVYLCLNREKKKAKKNSLIVTPKVLVVDDTDAEIFSIKKLLEKIDVTIYSSNSGEKAIQMVANNLFAIAIIDVQMTNLNGFETAEKIRQLPNGSSLPIIFVSANDKTDEAISNGYLSGGVDYLFKPINQSVFESKVNAYIQLNRDAIEKEGLIEKLKFTQQHLEIVNRNLVDYAHIISHDMKEPLRGICNYVDLLIETGNNLNEGTIKMLTMMKVMSKRAVTLLESMLEYAQIDSINQQPEKINTDLIVDETIELLKPMMEQRHVKVKKSEQLPTIFLDKYLFSNLLRNLITNAIKYNDNPEQIIEINYNPNNQSFSIRDNGIGIAPENFERIFKPSKRLHNKDAYEGGTGFGLALAKKITEKSGGTIWVESELGKGSTFYFSFSPVMSKISQTAQLK